MRQLGWLAFVLVTFLTACSTPSDPASGVPDVSGTWSAPASLSSCTAISGDLRFSLKQTGSELSGYVMLTVLAGGSSFDVLATLEGAVTEAGQVNATVIFPSGVLARGNLTAKLTLVNESLVGSITSDSLQNCSPSPPTKVTIVVDVPRTGSDFTPPPALPDISGDWIDETTEVNVCGVVTPVAVTVHLEQDELGFVRGYAHVDTTADLPTYTLLNGYVLSGGAGTLEFDTGNDRAGEALLGLLDTGVLEARFQYRPFECGGVPHTFYFEAELVKQAP